jgi:anthranilate synthase component 1
MKPDIIKNQLIQLNKNIFALGTELHTTPQIKEFLNDQLTPISVYAIVGGVGACMIESAYDEGYGHYSYIGFNPMATLSAIHKEVIVTDNYQQTKIVFYDTDPYLVLHSFMQNRRVFGTISYDAIRLKENIPNRHPNARTPDFMFHIYKTIIKFDHKLNKITISHEGSTDELDSIINNLFAPSCIPNVPRFKRTSNTSDISDIADLNITPNISDAEFMQMVEKAKEYIRAGDIFQVVLSRVFQTKTLATPFTIYRALRQMNPTAYLAFFEEHDYAIASSSPELLVGIKDGIIEIVPIAGTCKKGDDINDLLANPKETAEHVMLVDLARNDIGAMAKSGTVKVIDFKSVHSYSHVSHIVSRVIGELDPKYTALDVLKSALPAGTLSGAPKIRAMEIIDELETSKRGLYGGAIVTIDENGDLTSSIIIRTAIIYPDYIEVRTGAGIVLDSNAKAEAYETQLKSYGVIAALKFAESLEY